jgi:hypothetical protein
MKHKPSRLHAEQAEVASLLRYVTQDAPGNKPDVTQVTGGVTRTVTGEGGVPLSVGRDAWAAALGAASTEGVFEARGLRESEVASNSSDDFDDAEQVYLTESISLLVFRKSTPPQNRQLNIWMSKSRY